jgi:RNA polymerase sigma factor (sigma-70 family)
MNDKAEDASAAASASGEPERLSDAELIQAVAAGERWVTRQLYDRLYATVDHTLRRVLHGRYDELDDLVQVSFEQIIRSLAAGRLCDPSKLSPWAASIASHVAVDALRRRVREQSLFSSSESDVEQRHDAWRGGVERRMEARLDVARIQGVLSRMNPDQVHALLLHDVLGYEVAEIAAMVRVPVPAAQSRLRRARLELLRRTNRADGGGE